MKTRFQEWLDELPTTNLKTYTFIVLVIATFFLACAGMLVASVDIAHVKVTDKATDIFDSWLIFLGAFGGISVGQFLSKRATAVTTGEVAPEAKPAPGAPKKLVDESGD